jgi:hypothetical protein
MGKKRILVGKQEGKRPLGKPRRRWVDSIKMDLREMGWCGLHRSGSGYGPVRALVNTVMNLRFLKMLGIS